MKHYKEIINDNIVSYQQHQNAVDSEFLVEITESEYVSALEDLAAYAETESEAVEQSKDEYIAELEAENAALLFQVLTGEVFADV